MSKHEAQGGVSENRWWVDTSEQKPSRPRPKPGAPVGERLFGAGSDFNQSDATARLTDLNQRLLAESATTEGDWTYVTTVQGVSRGAAAARVKRQIQLPAEARGLIVDCGYSLRLLVTGKPPGQRILEFRLGPEPSFDCWRDGEWIQEESFRNTEEALRKARLYIKRHFG